MKKFLLTHWVFIALFTLPQSSLATSDDETIAFLSTLINRSTSSATTVKHFIEALTAKNSKNRTFLTQELKKMKVANSEAPQVSSNGKSLIVRSGSSKLELNFHFDKKPDISLNGKRLKLSKKPTAKELFSKIEKNLSSGKRRSASAFPIGTYLLPRAEAGELISTLYASSMLIGFAATAVGIFIFERASCSKSIDPRKCWRTTTSKIKKILKYEGSLGSQDPLILDEFICTEGQLRSIQITEDDGLGTGDSYGISLDWRGKKVASLITRRHRENKCKFDFDNKGKLTLVSELKRGALCGNIRDNFKEVLTYEAEGEDFGFDYFISCCRNKKCEEEIKNEIGKRPNVPIIDASDFSAVGQ